MNSIVELRNLSKSYAPDSFVIENLDLRIEEKDFKVVFGLPGCGKSVLMRLIMGLEKPTQGNVVLRGKEIAKVNPSEHNIGYVPQSFALFPHQTVYRNIAYPLMLQKMPENEIREEVTRVAKMLAIEDQLDKRPDQTSGGQKQRIAIARGIVKRTDLYILDDPFVGLDFKLREQLVYDLKDLQERLDTTFIYTTSDSSEALQLGKSVSILHRGRIIETNAPVALYHEPMFADSMQLLGFPSANMLMGRLEGGTLYTSAFVCPTHQDEDREVRVGIRPEHIVLGEGNEDDLCLSASVALREDLGGEEIVYLDIDGEVLTMMAWHHQELAGLEIGKRVAIHVRKDNIVCYDAQTQERIQKKVRA